MVDHAQVNQMRTVDVAICAYGKPFHTAVTIASLMRWSGKHIRKIYVQIEKHQPHGAIMDVLKEVFDDEIFVFYTPKIHIGINGSTPEELSDPDYRRSLRYQYGWEESRSDFLFLAHNDCVYEGDILGEMITQLENGKYAGVGLIGQCWNCPAHLAGLCGHDKYGAFHPTYEEAVEVVKAHPAPRTFVDTIDRDHPMPFPECRLNEFSCLIDMRIAREETAPRGGVPPIGVMTNDTGSAWFRQMALRGHAFKNWFHLVVHAPFNETGNGLSADTNKSLYDRSEDRAAQYLREKFPSLFYRLEFFRQKQLLLGASGAVKAGTIPSYAVLFKAHVWNPFVQRQFERAKATVGHGDLFVVLAGNLDPAAVSGCDSDKIIILRDSDAAVLGYVNGSKYPFYWYCKDYVVFAFYKRHPNYDFYLTIEYDAYASCDLDRFIREAEASKVDFVARQGFQSIDEWVWTSSCHGSYERDQIENWMSFIFLLSNRAVDLLMRERLVESRRVLKGEIAAVPYCEAAIPTLLKKAGMTLVSLNRFGNTAAFGWDCWTKEEKLGLDQSRAFFHPVSASTLANS